MGIYEHAREFAGLPVVDWDPDRPIDNPDGAAQRLTLGERTAPRGCFPGGGLLARLLGAERPPPPTPVNAATFERFLADPAAGRVVAIVVARWEGEEFCSMPPDRVVEEIAAARDRLTSLRALFLPDVTAEECEISWMQQGDLSPLLSAYPQLEHLRVRGGTGLSFGAIRHEQLRSFVVETGGLPAATVREVAAADLPALEHLELWFGAANYGGDATVDDVRPILSGDRFPRLRWLGLRDCEFADDLARAVATSPLLRRIEVLDLSLGTLGDDGAAALIDSGALASLKKLDVHHHFCSEEMVRRLTSLGTDVDASDPQEPDDEDRYVAVGE
jgi:hypothetical protein